MIHTDLNTLVRMRERSGLSISDVAAELGYKTPTGYWLIEHGERKVSVENLYRLAQLYGCAMEDFIVDN